MGQQGRATGRTGELRDGENGESEDQLQIRYSLTALGELAVAHGERATRGLRFHGFGPCVTVA